MRTCVAFLLVALCLAVAPWADAGEQNRYPNGVEGIKGGSAPPPGLWLRTYNFWYQSDRLKSSSGDKLGVGFDVDVLATAPRLIWITDKKILGANYGADILVPFIDTDLEIDALGVNDHEFDIGDVWVEPIILAWHGQQWDAAVGLAAFLPSSMSSPADPGNDYWSGVLTLGGTYYPDEAKTWSLSLLPRYEVHSENDDTNIRPGHDLHFEWGIGKAVPTEKAIWDFGAAGYCQWQVTDDSKADPLIGRKVKDRVFSAGPEIGVFIPKCMLGFQLRSLVEFGAKDRSEGIFTNLTVTKKF
jgi:hypothetical protein